MLSFKAQNGFIIMSVAESLLIYRASAAVLQSVVNTTKYLEKNI